MKLLKTEDYLLLIDEEVSIDINNYIVAKDLSGIAKVKEYKRGHILAIDVFQNTELGINYHQTSDWNKVVAYYPLTKEAKELDLPLLPNPFEQIDIEQLACEKYDIKEGINDYDERYYNSHNVAKAEAFIAGYKAAQSNKQFSLEDIKKTIEMAREANSIDGTVDLDVVLCFPNADNSDLRVKWSEEEIIQSLSTQKLPKEFIPEYDEIIVDKLVPKMPTDIIKTITNSESKVKIQGRYVY